MTRISSRVILCLLASFILMLGFTATSAKATSAKLPKPKMVSLFDYMNTMSLHLGCYYTVEMMKTSMGSTVFDNVRVIDNREVLNTTTLAAELKKQLNNILVLQDEKHRK